jgi:hypothetical protein
MNSPKPKFLSLLLVELNLKHSELTELGGHYLKKEKSK